MAVNGEVSRQECGETKQSYYFIFRIADNVLETLLLSVAKEMELNDVLENLYQSEFQ